jgi:IS30 family transposase
MDKDIRTYIASCVPCQINKTDRIRRTAPLSPLVAPDSCWRTLGVDLIVDLPVSEEGFNAVCVFVCHLSKMVRLIATKTDLTATGFAKLFLKVFPHYGFPLHIVSDRGTQWNSEFFRALCTVGGVQLHFSTAYHPQTNGLVERTNEMVSAALRSYVAPDMRDWPDSLSLVEFALNSRYHQDHTIPHESCLPSP